MHPALVLVPAAALVLGPHLWVAHVRRRYARDELDGGRTGAQIARELLDRHQLEAVVVEPTDIGDHYDLERRAVRLSRENHDRSTVAAIVTAAHEVGHAVQHASGYPPLRWRAALGRIAQVTAQFGGALLIAVPISAITRRDPLPPALVGGTIFAVLGTGVAAQLAALPTEWDASFGRALPMLEDGLIAGPQIDGAREMLLACSLTYVASSLASVLQFWPWLPRRPMTVAGLRAPAVLAPTRAPVSAPRRAGRPVRPATGRRVERRPTVLRSLVRLLGKPLMRGWYGARLAMLPPAGVPASTAPRATV